MDPLCFWILRFLRRRKRASRTIMTPAIAPTAIPALAPVERPELELVLKDVAGDEDGVGELGRVVEASELR
jgi:hypothetical protein